MKSSPALEQKCNKIISDNWVKFCGYVFASTDRYICVRMLMCSICISTNYWFIKLYNYSVITELSHHIVISWHSIILIITDCSIGSHEYLLTGDSCCRSVKFFHNYIVCLVTVISWQLISKLLSQRLHSFDNSKLSTCRLKMCICGFFRGIKLAHSQHYNFQLPGVSVQHHRQLRRTLYMYMLLKVHP